MVGYGRFGSGIVGYGVAGTVGYVAVGSGSVGCGTVRQAG